VIYLPDDTEEALWQEQKEGLSWYEEYQTAYVGSSDAVYSVVFLLYDHSQEQTEQFWAMYQDKTFAEDDSRIRLSSSFVDNLEMIDEVIVVLEKVFLYGGLILAAFAALLLSNFISVSIANKKREIGILRAVGARSIDVFKIFFSESFVIALICVALSTVISATACGAINALLAESLGASLFVFGIGSFGLVVGIAVVTAVIATFLPVWNAARKKPVDSIRSL
jgi:ABC-type antimicrobial peptide transport system permease subunit